MNEKRGPWYLITGLILGVALGLVYAWVINPVEYVDNVPSALRSEYKALYRELVAHAYQATGNLERARARMALIKDDNPSFALAAQSQRAIAQGTPASAVDSMAQLSAALVQQKAPTQAPGAAAQNASTTGTPVGATLDPANAVRSATPAPSATPQPSVTLTPRSTFTPRPVSVQPTAGSPFALKEKKKVCDTGLPQGLLQVQLVNSAGQPAPGVKIEVNWDGGADQFFTGLYTNVNPGYADFTMQPGIAYSLRVGDGGETVADLGDVSCSQSGASAYRGGWMLKFAQP